MSLLTELHLAARSLARSPMLAAVAVLSLALGIGANATICMVTHDPRYAKWADREVKLFDGKVVEEEEAGSRVGIHH